MRYRKILTFIQHNDVNVTAGKKDYSIQPLGLVCFLTV